MGGTGVATMVRSSALAHGTERGATGPHMHPLGLGSSTLPGHALSAGARPRLRRQWTTAKPGGDVSCNVLPFFLDLSLAFAPGMEFFDAVKSSVDSEVVFQATLQVPAHHALACRLNAYGTPFAAPDLQAAAHELGDADLEFAACLASPPDLDEQLSVNFSRVMSLLERNQGESAGQVATRATAAQGQAASNPGSGQSSVQQQLRSTPGASQQAPKVLVSVDEAESTAAHLQRSNSAKKPKFMSMAQGYGKRALQALLGLGYLLTFLHEKSLGGRIEFNAALTAAVLGSSPSMTDGGHIRPRVSSGRGMSSVLAQLRQFMRECPSLSPRADSLGRRSAAAAAAAVAAVDGSTRSGGGISRLPGSPLAPQLANSFEAAWERVLHPGLHSAGGSGGSSGSTWAERASQTGNIPACSGLQLQLSLSAPLRMSSTSMDGFSSPGATPKSVWTPQARPQQQQQQDQDRWHDQQSHDQQSQEQDHQSHDKQLLQVTDDSTLRTNMDALLEAAMHQVQQQDTGGANTAATTVAGRATPTPVTPKQQQQQGTALNSHYLLDQSPLTSPIVSSWAGHSAGGAAPLASPLGSPYAAPPGGRVSGSNSNSMPGTPLRKLLPVMSLRLTCQPAWQYSSSGSSSSSNNNQEAQKSGEAAMAAAAATHGTTQAPAAAAPAKPVSPFATAAAAAASGLPPAPPTHRQGVHMHQPTKQEQQQQEQQLDAANVAFLGSPVPANRGPEGLWPTMSFSLVPVRLTPTSPQHSGFRGPGASCLA